MSNILDNINKKLELIREDMVNFSNEERKEIKKNNKKIDDYVLELENINNVLLESIKGRYEELIPKEDGTIKIDDCLEYKNRIKYLSNNTYIFKMDIDKNLYEIKYSNSLNSVNSNILDLINKFKLINIDLSKEDFKYSISLYKYMSDFFKYKDSDEFSMKIKDSFDSLYWECSNLINHIYLCFIMLLDKNSDEFDNYVKVNYMDKYNYEETFDNYYKLVKDNDTKTRSDRYTIYNKFLSLELKIDDYLGDSTIRKEVLSKYVDYDKYINYNGDELNHFYEQIMSAYDDLCEYEWINKYSYLINKIKEIYMNKGNYVNNYNTFMKNMKSLEKSRISINNKLFVIYNKMVSKSNDRLVKKYNNLFNKVNKKIDEIIAGYDNYEEILFINDIIKKLDDDSTYYDAFKVIEGNYAYLINFMKDNDNGYEDFIDYLYSPYLNISKSIPMISEYDIESKLSSKYDLFDMDINLSDKNKLREDLEYIIRVCIYDTNKIELNNYKLVFDIKKIIDE